MTEDNKIILYYKQKETLDTFLKTGAISRAQYDTSLKGLQFKMGIYKENIIKDGNETK